MTSVSASPLERVVLTVASINHFSGGPVRVLASLAARLQQRQVEVEVLSTNFCQGSGDLLLSGAFPIAPLLLPFSPKRLREWRPLAAAVRTYLASQPVSVVHDNGLWTPFNWAIYWASTRARLPRLTSVHGMLEPWAMRHGSPLKPLVWRAFQRHMLATSAALHATSPEEVAHLRTLGLRLPIALIANPIEAPQPTVTPTVDAPPTAVFLSRIHPKKGLPMFLRAWAAVRPDGWRLVIAGPDEGGHVHQLRRDAKNLGLSDIEFPGPISDAERAGFFAHARLFVMPSYSENFGLAVAEAMGAGLPVITTTGTPWSCLRDERSGWWVAPTQDALAAALREAVAMSPETLAHFGARARAHVQRHYAPDTIATRFERTYRWIAEGADPACAPEFVSTEVL